MIWTGDDALLRRVLVTMAQGAGVTSDEGAVERLVPVLASLLNDREVLTREAAPEVEPMSVGRWPETSHEMA